FFSAGFSRVNIFLSESVARRTAVIPAALAASIFLSQYPTAPTRCAAKAVPDVMPPNVPETATESFKRRGLAQAGVADQRQAPPRRRPPRALARGPPPLGPPGRPFVLSRGPPPAADVGHAVARLGPVAQPGQALVEQEDFRNWAVVGGV